MNEGLMKALLDRSAVQAREVITATITAETEANGLLLAAELVNRALTPQCNGDTELKAATRLAIALNAEVFLLLHRLAEVYSEVHSRTTTNHAG